MKLIDIASIIRSKNAGPFLITIDVIFDNQDHFNYMKKSNIWTRSKIAEIYGIPEDRIVECIICDSAKAFKCTFRRKVASGSFGDTDIYGAQQHVPLYKLEI